MHVKPAVVILAALAVSVFAFSQASFTGYLTRTGQLQIGNSPPAVDAIYLNGFLATANPNDVTINPVEGSTRSIAVKITMEDANGNCNLFTSDNGTAYFCNGVVTCDSTNANHTATLVYNTSDGQWGNGNKYCNMSGTAGPVQFYELNGTWTVNVTVTDGVVNSTHLTKNWTYGELAAFSYATGGTVDMGTLNLEVWSNGTGQDKVNNTGNIVLNIAWNATNFTGQASGDYINISNNYIIDDDALSPDDSDSMAQVYIIPDTKLDFYPSSGLLRCTSVACSNTNSTYDVYWHIYLPAGLSTDTYTNSIEVTSTYH